MSDPLFDFHRMLGYGPASAYASTLQSRVRSDEAEQREKGLDIYTDGHERQAIIHTREDLILVIAYVTTIHHQLRGIGRTLTVCAVLLALLLWRLW